jgi:hypothetical protein
MADEKKEELKKEEVGPPKDEKTAQGGDKPAKERPTNCAGCKKAIKNRLWYYRNGSYYCTKRCWSVTNKKSVKTEETPLKT